MTIEKAIEINTIHNEHNPNYTDADREKAHQLGIEALRRIKDARTDEVEIDKGLLPGETKE